MLLALQPEDLQRFAIPIGIGIAVLVVVAVPSLRRALMECFRAGQQHGRKLSGREEPRQDPDDKPET
jgi:hypothetical protein